VAARQPVRTFVVEVDFTAKDEPLKEAFLRWLDTHPERKEWQARNPNKTSTHRPWRKMLLDIAVHRTMKAVGDRKAALELIWPLFKAWKVTEPDGRMSKEHWSHALARAKGMAKAPAPKKVASGGKGAVSNPKK